jgi:hypothetical protein
LNTRGSPGDTRQIPVGSVSSRIEHRDIVAARIEVVKKCVMKARPAHHVDRCFFPDFARQRLTQRLPGLNLASRKMPSPMIRVAHQEDPLLRIHHHALHTQGLRPDEPVQDMIETHQNGHDPPRLAFLEFSAVPGE